MPVCIDCGFDDFYLEDGKYYCKECNRQTEETQVVLRELESFVTARLVSSKKANQSFSVENFETWLTAEGFNIILKKQVEALINLGASGNLMHTVLQLWAKYLQKCEIAFVSDSRDWIPKMSTVPRYRDYEVLKEAAYLSGDSLSGDNRPTCTILKNGVKHHHKRTRKKPRNILTIEPIKKKKTKKDKEIDPNKILQPSSNADFSSVEDQDVDDIDEPEENLDVINNFSHLARKTLENLNEESRQSLWSKSHSRRFIDHITLSHTLCFCYAGILLNQEPITLSDLLRWVHDCKIPYTHAWTVLPKSMLPQKSDFLIFRSAVLPLRENVVDRMKRILRLLEVATIPKKPFEMMSLKILAELNLPLKLVSYLHQLVYERSKVLRDIFTNDWEINQYGSKTGYSRTNQEFEVIALCVVILKIVFGLDDCREKLLSEKAKIANKELIQFFVFDEWLDSVKLKLNFINEVFAVQFKTDNLEPRVCVDVDMFHNYYWNTVSAFKEIEPNHVYFKKGKKPKRKRRKSVLSDKSDSESMVEESEEFIYIKNKTRKLSLRQINYNMRKIVSDLIVDNSKDNVSSEASSFPMCMIKKHPFISSNHDSLIKENFCHREILQDERKESTSVWKLENYSERERCDFNDYFEMLPSSFRLVCGFVTTVYNFDCRNFLKQMYFIEKIILK